MEVNSQFLVPVALLPWKEVQIPTAHRISGSQDKYKRGYEKENHFPTRQSHTVSATLSMYCVSYIWSTVVCSIIEEADNNWRIREKSCRSREKIA
jgi:hypothetical protein